MDDAARARLADAMEERRLELAVTWKKVAAAGGITYETLRTVRNGRSGNIPVDTQRAIDRGLQWAPGSVAAILADGEARPLAQQIQPAEVVEGRLRILGATPEQLVEMRGLVEEALGREEADKFMTRAIAIRDQGATGDDTQRGAS